jgi:hypothetical protein
MSIITDETARARDGLAAPGIVTGLVDLATWYATRPSAPLVTPTLNIPVPDGTRGERISALDVIAERLGVAVTEHRGPDGKPDGTLFAERWFGGVRVEAHLCDPDRRVGGHRSLAAWQEAAA